MGWRQPLKPVISAPPKLQQEPQQQFVSKLPRYTGNKDDFLQKQLRIIEEAKKKYSVPLAQANVQN